MSLAQKIVVIIVVVVAVVGIVRTIIGGIGSLGVVTNGSLYNVPRELGQTPSAVEEKIATAPQEAEVSTGLEDTEDVSSRLVIKEGEFNMVVKDVVESAKKIIQYAKKKGGWVVQSNIQEVEDLPTANVIVRVPVGKFDETMTFIRGLAVKVNYEKSSGQDVTEEYVDLESRLKSLRKTKEQLLTIMEKAKTIEEILRIQSEISNIQSQIEQTKGSMLYLERSAETGTITANLALSEELLPIPPSEKWRPEYIARIAWKKVVAIWRDISYRVIDFFVYGLVWIPAIVVLYLIVWKTKRCLTKKKK